MTLFSHFGGTSLIDPGLFDNIDDYPILPRYYTVARTNVHGHNDCRAVLELSSERITVAELITKSDDDQLIIAL
jgi:hypothetical protein